MSTDFNAEKLKQISKESHSKIPKREFSRIREHCLSNAREGHSYCEPSFSSTISDSHVNEVLVMFTQLGFVVKCWGGERDKCTIEW